MKKIIILYQKNKIVFWIGIIVLSILDQVFAIVAIGFGIYELFILKKNVDKKIDKKSKAWNKKINLKNKNWNKKLNEIGKDWKKNPKKAIVPVLGMLVFASLASNFTSGSNPKNFKSAAGHSFYQVSYCLQFYREVVQYGQSLTFKHKEYINAHKDYLKFQEKALDRLKSDKYKSMNAYNILQEVKSSDEFSQYEKDSILGFTNAKLDYESRASWENSLTKFGCVLDLN